MRERKRGEQKLVRRWREKGRKRRVAISLVGGRKAKAREEDEEEFFRN